MTIIRWVTTDPAANRPATRPILDPAELVVGVTRLWHSDPAVAASYGQPGVFTGWHATGGFMIVDCGVDRPVAAHVGHWLIVDAAPSPEAAT